MTSLAIIGSGIAGRSLIYTLAKEHDSFKSITLISSDNITSPCTLNSTAVASLRGITAGHSSLGDSLVEGFHFLSEHVRRDKPHGVEEIIQYSAATIKTENFKSRFQDSQMSDDFLKIEALMAKEEAFLFDPQTYSQWLLENAMSSNRTSVELLNDFVVEIKEGEKIELRTMNGKKLYFDKVVFACGSYNRFWKEMAPETKLNSSKPAQGSYFEFLNVDWKMPSFSLTLDGDNVVWNAPFKRLYIGSTTKDSVHLMPPMKELDLIRERLQEKTTLNLPAVSEGQVKTGLREKAQKREPYIVRKNNVFFFGGLYKNAFTLSLPMSRTLSRQLL